MKKLTKLAVALALALSLVFCFAACDEEPAETTHEHNFGAWTTVKAATLFDAGSEERVCADDATHKETRALAAKGTTTDLFGFFGTYASASVKGEKGIVLNKDTTNETSASTYFGEEDKNFDWDGSEMTLKFKLDLSALEENEFTIFVLAFNQKEENAYKHAEEIRFGIAKTATGYVFNELVGVNNDEAMDLAGILDSDKTFTASDVEVSLKFSFNAENDTLTYEMAAGGVKETNSKVMPGDVVGLRSLWNAYLKGDGVELYNLVKA